VTRLSYASGEEISEGDRIMYFGDFGYVEFIVLEMTGNQLRDWYLQRHSEGGLMVNTGRFGRVFISAPAIDDDLVLLSREPNSSRV
jgi:hypothetical protein